MYLRTILPCQLNRDRLTNEFPLIEFILENQLSKTIPEKLKQQKMHFLLSSSSPDKPAPPGGCRTPLGSARPRGRAQHSRAGPAP